VKHSSLLCQSVNYAAKKFYDIGSIAKSFCTL
jgi:hypothetical protein